MRKIVKKILFATTLSMLLFSVGCSKEESKSEKKTKTEANSKEDSTLMESQLDKLTKDDEKNKIPVVEFPKGLELVKYLKDTNYTTYSEYTRFLEDKYSGFSFLGLTIQSISYEDGVNKTALPKCSLCVRFEEKSIKYDEKVYLLSNFSEYIAAVLGKEPDYKYDNKNCWIVELNGQKSVIAYKDTSDYITFHTVDSDIYLSDRWYLESTWLENHPDYVPLIDTLE